MTEQELVNVKLTRVRLLHELYLNFIRNAFSQPMENGHATQAMDHFIDGYLRLKEAIMTATDETKPHERQDFAAESAKADVSCEPISGNQPFAPSNCD
jgi:hypothetical protein